MSTTTLYVAPTSPFARLVRVALAEIGMEEAVAVTPVDPWALPRELLSANPLSRVPALRLADGRSIVESWAIALWIDGQADSHRLLPVAEPQRTEVLALWGLAHGIMECAFTAVVEGRRPEAQRSADRTARLLDAVRRGVAALETRFTWNMPDPAEPLDLGDIATVCALTYLDFRHADLAWRADAPNLDDWSQAVAQRPSLRTTAF